MHFKTFRLSSSLTFNYVKLDESKVNRFCVWIERSISRQSFIDRNHDRLNLEVVMSNCMEIAFAFVHFWHYPALIIKYL